jgi:hypothetical protein
MAGKQKIRLVAFLIPLLLLISLPVNGSESSSQTVSIVILPYSEADLVRQVSTEFYETKMGEAGEFPFFSNDFQSRRITAFVGDLSTLDLFGNMEIDMADKEDLSTLRQTVKTANCDESFVEITYTITDR